MPWINVVGTPIFPELTWTTATSSTAPIIQMFVDASTLPATVTYSNINNWQPTATTSVLMYPPHQGFFRMQPAAPSDAELMRQGAEIGATYRRQAAARRAASDRARELLESFLSEEQRQSLRRHDCFEVEAPSGRVYRIRRGLIGNIDVLGADRREVMHRLCVHPDNAYAMPREDTMLAQLLWLRNEERETLRAANIHPAHRY